MISIYCLRKSSTLCGLSSGYLRNLQVVLFKFLFLLIFSSRTVESISLLYYNQKFPINTLLTDDYLLHSIFNSVKHQYDDHKRMFFIRRNNDYHRSSPFRNAKVIDNKSRKNNFNERQFLTLGNTSVKELTKHKLVGCKIAGVGSCVPDKVVSNAEIEKVVDTSDEWIFSRTGIKNRRIISSNETLAEIASLAAKRALEYAKVPPDRVDLIIYACSTSTDLFGDATYIQDYLKAKNAAAFDLRAACSGFLFALITGSEFIRSGNFKNVLVVGGDELSKYVDWTDRNTCILFGDGTGAVLLSSCEDDPYPKKNRILGWKMLSDGKRRDKLVCPIINGHQTSPFDKSACSSASPTSSEHLDKMKLGCVSQGRIKMDGKDVFKFATKEVADSIDEFLNTLGVPPGEIDWLLLHQANIRIIQNVANRLNMPSEKILYNLDQYGNTSAGSIPLCLDEAVQNGKIKSGDKILIAGFGAGLSWGSLLIEWD